MPRRNATSPRGEKLLLVLVLAAAAVLRILPAREGLPYLHDWDEPLITSTALHLVKTGETNPRFFHYGSLAIYLQAAVDVAHYLVLLGESPIPFPTTSGIYGHEEIDLDAIETWHETGWLWSVSHPSFVLWNRGFSALVGTLTVLLVFLLARRLAGPGAALLAAALLAVQGFHIERSALANPEGLMTLLAFAAIWGAAVFVERPRRGPWLLALIAAGLATATKLNGAMCVLAPAAALAVARVHPATRHRVAPWMAWALPVVPVLAFLAASPWALLDLPSFLRQAGFELYHYAAAGHAAVDVEPGWPHLVLQCERVVRHFGLAAVLLALWGGGVVARRRAGFVTVVYPLVYFLYMATTRVSFHRNLLVVYPVLAVLAAAGAVHLVGMARTRTGRFAVGWRVAAVGLGVVLAVHLGLAATRAASEGWTLWHRGETRSQAIDAVGELARGMAVSRGMDVSDGFRVGLAEELRFHHLDLERLDVAYEVAPHLDLVCDPARFDLVVTGTEYLGLWSADQRRRAWQLGRALLEVERTVIESPPDGAAVVRLDGLSEDPAVVIHLTRRRGEGRPEICGQGIPPRS